MSENGTNHTPEYIGEMVTGLIKELEDGILDSEVDEIRQSGWQGGQADMRKFVKHLRYIKLRAWLEIELEKRWEVDLSPEGFAKIKMSTAKDE